MRSHDKTSNNEQFVSAEAMDLLDKLLHLCVSECLSVLCVKAFAEALGTVCSQQE